MEERRRQKVIDDEVERKYANATLAESEAHRKVHTISNTIRQYQLLAVLHAVARLKVVVHYTS
jgi:hypothetical protein